MLKKAARNTLTRARSYPAGPPAVGRVIEKGRGMREGNPGQAVNRTKKKPKQPREGKKLRTSSRESPPRKKKTDVLGNGGGSKEGFKKAGTGEAQTSKKKKLW